MTVRSRSSKLVWSPILGWALLSCAAGVARAQVETPSPARQTLDQQTPTVDLPGSSEGGGGDSGGGGAGAGNANELGVSVGSFTLYPVLEVNTGFDTNPYASAPPTTSTPYESVRPALDLQSEWSNHSLRVAASGLFGFYQNASSQNFQNYTLQADGRIDIRADMYLTVSAAFKRATEALGTPNVSFAQAPTIDDSVPIEVSFYHRLNRLYYQVTGAATRYWYYDFSTISSLGLPAESRDMYTFEEKVRVGYDVSDSLSLFVAPSLNQRNYVNPVNSAGQSRSSSGFSASVGAALSLTATTSLQASVGLMGQTYAGDGTSTTATSFSLSGSWNGYDPLTLKPIVQRSINESALSQYINYVSTTIGTDFTYNIHGPWKAIGGLSYNTADYTPAPGTGANPRTDYFVKGSLGVTYDFRPQYSIGPVYEYNQGWSTDVASGGPQYSRSLFSIRLVARR
jgi:hypothetical protein